MLYFQTVATSPSIYLYISEPLSARGCEIKLGEACDRNTVKHQSVIIEGSTRPRGIEKAKLNKRKTLEEDTEKYTVLTNLFTDHRCS